MYSPSISICSNSTLKFSTISKVRHTKSNNNRNHIFPPLVLFWQSYFFIYLLIIYYHIYIPNICLSVKTISRNRLVRAPPHFHTHTRKKKKSKQIIMKTNKQTKSKERKKRHIQDYISSDKIPYFCSNPYS